jgi:hypothetical protein
VAVRREKSLCLVGIEDRLLGRPVRNLVSLYIYCAHIYVYTVYLEDIYIYLLLGNITMLNS